MNPADLEQIGPYPVRRYLTEGGMAWVFEVTDPRFDARRALKLLKPEAAHGEEFRRFEAEARILAQLDHPNLVTIYDLDRDDSTGCFYYTMQFVDGASLSQLKPLKPARAAKMILGALSALGALHARGIVHRDVKPSNIFTTADGHPMLGDLGIASASGETEAGLTRTGTAIGTPLYMSPEQARGGTTTAASDLYSMGLTLYEVLTGESIYNALEDTDASSAMEVFLYVGSLVHSGKDLEIPAMPGVPAAIRRVIEMSTRLSPDARYAGADQMARALEAALEESSRPSWLARLKTTFRKPSQPEAEPASGQPSSAGTGPAHPPEPAGATAESGDDRPVPAPPAPSPETPLPDDRTVAAGVGPARDLGTVVGAPIAQEQPPQNEGLGDHTEMLRIPAHDNAEPVSVAITVVRTPGGVRAGMAFAIERTPFRIGRAEDADLRLDNDRLASRLHAEIVREESVYVIKDLSTNGMLVNGRRVAEKQALFFGDAITVSNTELTFSADLPQPADLTGRVLNDRYTLEEQIHASVKSSTYIARDTRPPRQVAVKIFSPLLSSYEHYVDEFERQAHAAAELAHPNICKIFDFGEGTVEGAPESTRYLCMELLDGGHIGKRIEADPPASIETALGWLRALAGALDHAHERGLVHGGIKPNCIVFDASDRPYLSDFSGAYKDGDETTGYMLGAPPFVAPEQWEGSAPTGRTDQYSLAVIAYALLTGSRPFVAQDNPEAREQNFLRGPLPAHQTAARNGRDLPDSLDAVLAQALSVDPSERHASATAFADKLEEAVRRTRRSGAPRVFVSYRRESSPGWPTLFATELEREHGIEVFLDTRGADNAAVVPKKIVEAITDCDVFVCLLAPGTLDSDWVNEEVRIAHDLGKPMIPVLHEEFQRERHEGDPEHIVAMLNYDPVHLFDRRNVHVPYTITEIAAKVKNETR